MSGFLKNLDKIEELRDEIADLRRQINTLRKEQNKQKELIEKFLKCQRTMNEATNDWKAINIRFNNILLSPVRLVYYFEGDCAEKATGEILPSVAEMNMAAAKAGLVAGAISSQISVLQEYISQLGKQIDEKQNEIANKESQINDLIGL